MKNHQYEKVMNDPNFKIKLNLIVSQEEILYFSLTDQSTTGDYVYRFILNSMINIIQQQRPIKENILIMDNAPKNRSKKIVNLAKKKIFKIIYIVPGTPQQNFIEIIFLLLKNKMKSYIENLSFETSKEEKQYLI